MLSDLYQALKESRWIKQGAWVVLGAGLCLSVWTWWQAAESDQHKANEVFQRHVSDVAGRIEHQIQRHQDALISFQSLFMVNGEVSRRTFHQRFVDLHAQQDYPALLAIQYAPLTRAQERPRLEQQVQQDRSLSARGYPDFRIHPVNPQGDCLPVVYNEPMEPNLRAFGHDQASTGDRKALFEKARDTGRPQASQPTTLLQDESGAAGLLLRLPVYRPDMPTQTVAQRRAAYLGQISGIFRIADLIHSLAPDAEWQQWHWQIQDTTQAPLQLVFDSAQPPASQTAWAPPAHVNEADQLTRQIDIAGRQWTLTLTRPHVSPWLLPYPLALLFGGTVCSVALFMTLRNAASRHEQAAQLALGLSDKARDNEAHLRSVLDHTADGILTLSASGHLLGVNKAMCRIFGYARSDMVGRHLSQFIPAVHRFDSIDDFLAVQCTGMDGVGHRTEGLRVTGVPFPIDLSVGSMDRDGQRVHIVVLRDLSPQQSIERAVVEAQRQLNEVDEMRRVIVHNAPYAILVLNSHGVIQSINPAGESLLGYTSHQLVGRSTTQRFFDPEQIAARARMLAIRTNQPVDDLQVLPHLAQESPGEATEWNLTRADGSIIVAELLVNVLTDEAGNLTGYLAMAHDVTQRRMAEDQLQHVAMHDALTALPNRNMLQEQLKSSLQQAERGGFNLAMMFLDLDRFKKINDTLGHHIGDSVLIEVARRLRSAMRTSDIVARLGGDEFVILLPRIAEEADGQRVAHKVLDLFVEPLRVGPHEMRVTPSIGLALYPQHGIDAITLMRHADLAMYQAKSAGRNRIEVYTDQMESPTPESLVLENDLYKALERDELRLHYQPQFECATGAIIGVEALLRWEHGGKLVPPSDFIPLAEETGLIVSMGEWVLRQACSLAQRWRERTGWPLRMAVNLSAVQLDQAGIVEVVASALRDTGLPPEALELEITESVVVRESLRAADVLNQLRSLGVSIAIDDFGVGYSSFAYLRELPVDRFKLDRSFLTAIPQSEADSRLASALIAMAHRLEVGIVAEGVETAEQAAFLNDHGCDECQGFYLGRPMPDERFETLLIEHSRTHHNLLDELVARQSWSARQKIASLAHSVTPA